MTTTYILQGFNCEENGPDCELFAPCLFSELELAQDAAKGYVADSPFEEEPMEWVEFNHSSYIQWTADLGDFELRITAAGVDGIDV